MIQLFNGKVKTYIITRIHDHYYEFSAAHIGSYRSIGQCRSRSLIKVTWVKVITMFCELALVCHFQGSCRRISIHNF